MKTFTNARERTKHLLAHVRRELSKNSYSHVVLRVLPTVFIGLALTIHCRAVIADKHG
jgi:hypothetical protein